MMIHRAFRYRLYPTAEQATAMEQAAGAVRFVYNLALEQRRDFWRQAKAKGVALNRFSQGQEVTQLRAEVPWLAAVHSTPLTQALRDLDKAFAAFWRGAGYPGFRNKDRRCSFRHKGIETPIKLSKSGWARIRVPKIGLVKLRLSREWLGRLVSATFSRNALGWHVSLACEIEHEVSPSELPAIGIDRGIANTLALSTGEMLSAPPLGQLERRKRKAQRVLARRVRGSHRYRKQRRRLGRLVAKMTRVRDDWQHRVTTDLVQRFGVVTLEDLNIAGMTRKGRGKRGLNRCILEQGWHGIELRLAYKLEERGGVLIKVNPAYTSQTCSACGSIDKNSRESQSRYSCRHCGHVEHADTNAAKNILRRRPAVVEGSGYAPVEASTLRLCA